MGMTKVKALNKQQANSVKGQTGGEKLKKLSESELKKAMLEDPDAKPVSDYDANAFRPFFITKNKLGLK